MTSAKKKTAEKLTRSHKRARSEGDARKSAAAPRSATVLIVDDDPSVLRSLKRLVSASGFNVSAFNKPSDLLASETPKSNACMVVDIGLPEMTGVAMCEILKTLGRGLPTVFITGRTDARTQTLAAQSDPVAVLFKPFEQEPLLDAIARALASSPHRAS